MTIDLTSLPTPEIIDSNDFEGLLAAKISELQTRDPAFTALVESDPAFKLLEVDAYDELLVRERVNEVARSRLLAFAANADLDHLGAFYGVSRLVGEGDEALRTRIRERIMGSSAAGGRAHYRYHALSADPRIRDIEVDSPSGGVVRVSVLSKDGDGSPDATMLANVANIVQSTSVAVICHTVQVVSAQLVPVDVAAEITLLPTTPMAVFDGLEDYLRVVVDQSRGLGWNLTTSWLIAKLHVGGVQHVRLTDPTSNITIASNQCVSLDNVTLTFAGRSY